MGRRWGRIINISSLAQEGSSGQANYAAAKAGLIGLTKTLAREYGPRGITSNVVTVGYVATDMTEDHMASKLQQIWMEYCPLKRVGTAEEIASLVRYLSTAEAGFINGEVIRVAGGLSYAP
jgi:NAD(P)-dependent dehydrogenase (short-subunit alcohol dehydrogenase family)